MRIREQEVKSCTVQLQPATTVDKGLNKLAKLIMVGQCPNCGAEVASRFPFEIGLCRCKNSPVEVPLQLAIIPAKRIMEKIEQVSSLSGVPVEKLVNAMLKEASKQFLEGKFTIRYKMRKNESLGV